MVSDKPKDKGYLQDSQYKRMISAYQNGKWEEAGKRLARLMKKYPGEAELKSLTKGILLRKHIETEAAVEDKQAKKKSFRRIVFISLALAIFAAISFSAYNEYSVQVQQQINQRNLDRSLASKFQRVQNYLQAGRPVEAIGIISEISSIDASYPQLDEAVAQAEFLLELEGKYDAAAVHYQEENYTAALETLVEIFEIEPNFRDVEIQINSLELKKNISIELLAIAEEAYSTEYWISAISNYESAFENDPSIVDAELRSRLFASYVGESKDILERTDPSLSEVSLAEDYLRKAQIIFPEKGDELSADLGLIDGTIVQNYSRIAQDLLNTEPDSIDNMEAVITIMGRSLLINPDDQSIRLQYDLARNYVLGLENFEKDLLIGAIENLEFVYSSSEEYGAGTARQLLYEAHSKLGRQWFEDADFNNALDEFEIAERIALEDATAPLRSYEAALNIAITLGQLELFRESSNAFYSAVLVSGVKNDFSPENEAVLNLIYKAEIVADSGDFQLTYEQYAEALSEGYVNYDAVEYLVQSGDYLAQIARNFSSTIAAIKMSSALGESNEIFVGQELSIPVLRD